MICYYRTRGGMELADGVAARKAHGSHRAESRSAEARVGQGLLRPFLSGV